MEVAYKIVGYHVSLEDVFKVEEGAHILYKYLHLNRLLKYIVHDYNMLRQVSNRNLQFTHSLTVTMNDEKIHLYAYNRRDYKY